MIKNKGYDLISYKKMLRLMKKKKRRDFISMTNFYEKQTGVSKYSCLFLYGGGRTVFTDPLI